MTSDTAAAFAQVLDISVSQSGGSRSLLTLTPSVEYDAEGVGSRYAEGLGVSRTTENLPPGIPDEDSPSTPTPLALASRILNVMNLPRSQLLSLLNRSTVSDGLPVYREEPAGSQSNEEATTTTTTTQSWYGRPLTSLTFYGELSIASTPEEFALVRARLQQELTFDGGFLVALAAIDAAMFAMTPDSEFKIDSYAFRAIGISAAACGLGISCDIWFLLRYIWVDLETFTYRSRDVYNSYIFFSLSSRLPTLCTMVSSITLMAFFLLVVFNVSPVGVLAVGILVVLVMTMQFIVYGTHQFAAFALGMGAISMANIYNRFRGMLSGWS